MKDYYNILGIRKNASPDEIRKAYRSLALQFHPDKNDSNSFSEIFKDINEAKQVLLNESRKRDYDLHFEDEKPVGFFNKVKRAPRHIKVFKKAGEPAPFIKRGPGKKLVLVTCFAVLFLSAMFFFIKSEENEPAKLTILAENNNNTEGQKSVPSAELKKSLPADDTVLQQKRNVDSMAEQAIAENKLKRNLAATPNEEGNVKETSFFPREDKKELKSKNTPHKMDETSTVSKLHQKEKSTVIKTAVLTPKPSLVAKEVAVTSKTSNPENEVKTNLPKPEKVFATGDMKEIMDKIVKEKARMKNNSNCIQVRMSTASNVKNGFKLADFLRTHGFIISGRETVSATVDQIKIEAADGCVKVTIGTF